MLQSFRDKDTERVWQRQRSKRLDQPTQRAALRKLLIILDAADEIGDLRIPPGNRLARYFGTSERFWLNLQSRYELDVERDRLARTLDQIEPLAIA